MIASMNVFNFIPFLVFIVAGAVCTYFLILIFFYDSFPRIFYSNSFPSFASTHTQYNARCVERRDLPVSRHTVHVFAMLTAIVFARPSLFICRHFFFHLFENKHHRERNNIYTTAQSSLWASTMRIQILFILFYFSVFRRFFV